MENDVTGYLFVAEEGGFATVSGRGGDFSAFSACVAMIVIRPPIVVACVGVASSTPVMIVLRLGISISRRLPSFKAGRRSQRAFIMTRQVGLVVISAPTSFRITLISSVVLPVRVTWLVRISWGCVRRLKTIILMVCWYHYLFSYRVSFSYSVQLEKAKINKRVQ